MPSKNHCLMVGLGAALLVSLTAVGPAIATERAQPSIAVERLEPTSFRVDPQIQFEEAVLRVVGPRRFELHKRFKAGTPIEVDLLATESWRRSAGEETEVVRPGEDTLLPDGRYKYEAVFYGRGNDNKIFSGQFFVENGYAMSRAAKRAQLASIRTDLVGERRKRARPEGASTPEAFYYNYITIYDDAADDSTYLMLHNYTGGTDETWGVWNLYGDLRIEEDTWPAIAGTNRLTIQRGGGVGIGTTAPANDLHIADSVPAIRLHDTDVSGAIFDLQSIQGAPEFRITDVNTGTNPFVIEEGAPSDSLAIDSTGFVGIGTGAPSAPLHVFGSGGGTLQVERNDGTTPNIRFRTTGGGVTQNWLFQNNAQFGTFAVRDETAGVSPLKIFPANPENTLVLNGGKVGIGTGSPAGKLDVNGSIYQRGGLLHADFVFEPGYELESIEKHASDMWENKHLPAIPKATVDEQGLEIVEIGAHRRGIVEELEKAHIYIEQLNQALKDKEARVAELEEQNVQMEERLQQVESILRALPRDRK